MSEVKVNKISPRTNCGTTQLGDAGDTITVTGDLKSNSIKSASGSTITLGQSGDTIQLGCGASQTGFGRTGTVDWDTTAKTASFTAVSGNGYFVNTTSGAITVTLPAGSAGDIVSLADYAGTWQTNAVTVTPNGTDKIGGGNTSVGLTTEGQSVTFVYTDSTQGWLNTMDSTSNVRGSDFIQAAGGTITICGDCKIHTFTGPGTFTVSSAAACSANNVVSHLVVAGGGGGGRDRAGGGGAGGFREVKSPVTPYTASPLDGYPSAPNRVTVTAQAYPITVGGGGTGGFTSPANTNGTNGNNSIFSTITSAGGGGGHTSNKTPYAGNPGGSGGGGAGSVSGTGGTGNTPPVSPAQGNNGGSGQDGPNSRGAGGGGAGAAAANASTTPSSAPGGGTGVTTGISGSSTTYAGGGGGTGGPPPTSGPGGSGGGGAGGDPTGSNGTDNTGGGGGGSHSANGATGGSGIVIIRYKYQ